MRRAGSETYTFTAERFTFTYTKRRRIGYGYVNGCGYDGMTLRSGSLSGLESDSDSDIDLETLAAEGRPGSRTKPDSKEPAQMKMKKPQIIAMGGGGFSMEPDNPLLDEYFLAQTGKQKPSVCFVPTASGDSDTYIVKFLALLGSAL